MRFEYEYPMFAVVHHVIQEGESVTFHGLRGFDHPDGSKAVAVFTDRPGAEQYRDDNCPDHVLFAIPDAETWLGFLTIVRPHNAWVAFDPWRNDKGVQSVRIDALIQPNT